MDPLAARDLRLRSSAGFCLSALPTCIFQGERAVWVVEEIRAGRCELSDFVEPFGSMLVGEAFGVTAVTLEPIEVASDGVFVGLLEVCGDGLIDE